MMRAPTAWSVAVRRPDGVIEARREELPRLSSRSRLAKIPFIRGIMVLGESLTLGFRALSWSAQKAAGEDEEELSKASIVGAMTIALVFFVAFFMLLPLLVARGAERLVGESTILFNVVDGLVRILFFVAYIWAIGRSKDIKRVFEYHGAEHKTIHAYEAGDPLQMAAIQRYSPRHPRCGTNFLLIVILIAIVVFTAVGRPSLPWLVASRIVLIPVIAGFSYEVLKAAADYRWMAVASRPGIWLQRLTTSEPSDDQVEVAVASLLAALGDEARASLDERGPITPGALGYEVS
ncbi:MAG: hypothetical protein A2Z12_09460 [Actinobacteria bacterium RBG_16_68_21]|nr:MAG: hypothetical protein A2Z12_09460 [Actinobacteria bacterium RBG_16_68_21]